MQLNKKICLLGDFAVGKTSLVRRFVYSMFDDRYISTIGVKVSRKTLTIPHGTQAVDLTLLIWDLAGSEEFNRMQSSYLRGAAGAVLVWDLTRPETILRIKTYHQNLLEINPQARFVLAGNKADLVAAPGLLDQELERFSQAHGIPVFLTSAKTGENVEEAFVTLGALLIEP